LSSAFSSLLSAFSSRSPPCSYPKIRNNLKLLAEYWEDSVARTNKKKRDNHKKFVAHGKQLHSFVTHERKRVEKVSEPAICICCWFQVATRRFSVVLGN